LRRFIYCRHQPQCLPNEFDEARYLSLVIKPQPSPLPFRKPFFKDAITTDPKVPQVHGNCNAHNFAPFDAIAV
jgi:hypothetical protein